MIDRRLFPLLETLAASGLDWLVMDILAVVEVGELETESEAAMSAAQELIRIDKDLRSQDEAYLISSVSRPWSGEEQVNIAADIVMTRIKEVLLMTQSSIEVISKLIDKDDGSYTKHPVGRLAMFGESGALEYAIDIAAVGRALSSLTELQLRIEEWRSKMLASTGST